MQMYIVELMSRQEYKDSSSKWKSTKKDDNYYPCHVENSTTY